MTKAVQEELVFEEKALTAEELSEFLNESFGESEPRPVSVKLTRNRVSMISIDPRGRGPIQVRLHKEFLKAPKEVVRDLRRYLRTHKRAAWRNVARFAQGIDTNKEGSPGRAPLETAGTVYDLTELYREVNKRHFHGRVHCEIGWGRKRPASRLRGLRSIRFGSWNRNTARIRIHPLLDDARVPREFVEYIVFHEMLHAVVPEVRRGGRRYDHSPEFQALERAFPGIERMEAMAKKVFSMLQKDSRPQRRSWFS